MQGSYRNRVTRFGCVAVLLMAGYSAGLVPCAAYGADADLNAGGSATRSRQAGVAAVSSETFLSSLGVVTFTDQGVDPDSYIMPLRYTGIRNIRDGIRNLPGLLMLHQRTGIKVNLIGIDLDSVLAAARSLAAEDALLSLEGPNEVNNFPIVYKGQPGGGTKSWMPVAQFQKDLYKAVKSDPLLKRYPVFHLSEGGAEADNVGVQFLTIPKGAGTLLPDGTEYADYANPHNYVSGISIRYIDNQAWQAADPTLHSHWDGLYSEYGKTWKMGFQGYSDAQLETLPRVTTETGWDSDTDHGGERVQGIILVNVYLAQFKRGWRYTFIYDLRDNEGGGGHDGIFNPDSTPKLSATYIHNLTSVLAGGAPIAQPGKLNYSIANGSGTVHDLLLEKATGTFELIIWGEQVSGQSNITVDLGGIYKSVRIYDITAGTTPVWSLRDVRTVPIAVSDHAMIIEIK